jgi:hypothetical protein
VVSLAVFEANGLNHCIAIEKVECARTRFRGLVLIRTVPVERSGEFARNLALDARDGGIRFLWIGAKDLGELMIGIRDRIGHVSTPDDGHEWGSWFGVDVDFDLRFDFERKG